MSTARARRIGLPVSTLSASARRSRSSSMRRATASSSRERSAAGVRDQAGKARAGDKEGEVSLDGLKSAVPGAWKQEEPASRMRFAQFRLPRAKDDKAEAQVIIFRGLGGSARQNVDRWKAQFVPPEGKKIDDVARVQEMKVGGHPATYLDVSGTYLDQPPFAAGGKAVRRPG